MILRIAAALAALCLLAGCSDADWDRAGGFLGLDATPAAPPAVAVAAPAPPASVPVSGPAPGQPDPFCAAVAAHDSGQNGFDAATQARIFAQSYGQCLAIFGPGH
jgi:hypothetical protein